MGFLIQSKMINDKFMVLNQLLIVLIDDGFMINGSFDGHIVGYLS